MVKDAMGYEIELNSYYAYSHRKNGIVNVVIGKVIFIDNNTLKVKLEVINKGCGVYEKAIEKTIGSFRNTSIFANSIFKIESPEVNWS